MTNSSVSGSVEQLAVARPVEGGAELALRFDGEKWSSKLQELLLGTRPPSAACSVSRIRRRSGSSKRRRRSRSCARALRPGQGAAFAGEPDVPDAIFTRPSCLAASVTGSRSSSSRPSGTSELVEVLAPRRWHRADARAAGRPSRSARAAAAATPWRSFHVKPAACVHVVHHPRTAGAVARRGRGRRREVHHVGDPSRVRSQDHHPVGEATASSMLCHEQDALGQTSGEAQRSARGRAWCGR